MHLIQYFKIYLVYIKKIPFFERKANSDIKKYRDYTILYPILYIFISDLFLLIILKLNQSNKKNFLVLVDFTAKISNIYDSRTTFT